MNDNDQVTIKVYEKSRKKLRIISALKGELHLDTVERLLDKELKRLEKAKKK